eukprot:7633657-Pyramimonas_sp.AAC.1
MSSISGSCKRARACFTESGLLTSALSPCPETSPGEEPEAICTKLGPDFEVEPRDSENAASEAALSRDVSAGG